jgi:uncharacterized protein YidB (DUF937 family)
LLADHTIVTIVTIEQEEDAMGILDGILGGSVKDVLGQVEAAATPALISAVLAKTNLGNLQGLVNQLQQGGLGTQVQSWLGSGANMSITPDQLRAALGSDQVKQLAAHFGIPIDQALQLLSQQLPAAVDAASPNGRL